MHLPFNVLNAQEKRIDVAGRERLGSFAAT
jgi:hypothetical protein